tara:strand:+ start:43 stop:234 length:192 start_codon:yes stop_codon:yes gene_type:complete
MTNQEIEIQLPKLHAKLAEWQALLAKARKPGKIGERSAQVSWHNAEIARLQGILFARHCDEQV